MKVLITGGCGFIGSNIAEACVKDGYEVVILDNFFLGRTGNIETIKDQVKLVKGDVRDEKLIMEIMDGVDYVIHQAAASSSGMFRSDLKGSVAINIEGTINLLNAAKEKDVKRFIYASTSSIYANNQPPLREDMFVIPPNFYAATKLEKEYLATIFSQDHGLETVGLRYMSVYGPHEDGKGIYANLVTQFLWSMQKGEQPIIYGDGKQTRDFTYVKDIVQANMLAMTVRKKMLGEIFNVGTGTSHSLVELVSIINKILGTDIQPKYVNIPVKGYILSQCADISKIGEALDYKPRYSLESGIKDMLALS